MSIINDVTLLGYLDALQNVDAKRSEGLYSRTADNFEDSLLEFSDFPDEYFEFVKTVLTDEMIYSKPGVWNFLLVMGTEDHKLVEGHYQALGEIFLKYYRCYSDPDLCLGVCDFIARNYSKAAARALLISLKDIEREKHPELQGFANEGMRILELESARKSK
jgi:hypothetical protein